MRQSLYPRSVTLVAALLAFLIRPAQADEPLAISVPFGPDFIGYDGLWSPVQIRVGSPEQYLLVLPSTISAETWVAGPGLCSDATCASKRGGIFYDGNSTTWDSLGSYDLGYSPLSESTPAGAYGFDKIALSDSLSLSNQVVAIVDDVDHWVGQIGMGAVLTRFDNNTNYLPLISTLVQNNSAIPSHSYSYTAGASYKGSGTPGSLVLGGTDTTRYVPNNSWFVLADNYVPSVALKSMSVSSTRSDVAWTTNPLQVYPGTQAAMFTIDSSTPYLWLPENVCENIAAALGLTWDPTIELYRLANGTAQDRLDMGMDFTFNLASTVDSNELLALKVSYDAFNLQLSYPFPGLYYQYSSEKIPYFPMRRANNTLQYTIGRAFLQEIHLMVDYERNLFHLSQALFPDNSQGPVLAQISRPDNSGWPGPATSGSSGLSTAAKAGIAVAIALVICIVVGVIWFCYRRKRRDSSVNEKAQKRTLFSLSSKRTTQSSSAATSHAELTADKTFPNEMNSDSSNSRYELPSSAPIEMSAGEVAPTFFQPRQNARIAQINDPRSPIELVQPTRNSTSKDEPIVTAGPQRPTSVAPPYQAVEFDHGYAHTNTNSSSGHGVSPETTGRGGLPSNGSDHIISPITGPGSDPNRSSRNRSPVGSDGSRFLSPISPIAVRSDGRSTPQSTASSDRPSQTQGAPHRSDRDSLSPIPAGTSIPRRSASRDSRFREELVEDAQMRVGPPESQPVQQSNRSSKASAKRSRFSWED